MLSHVISLYFLETREVISIKEYEDGYTDKTLPLGNNAFKNNLLEAIFCGANWILHRYFHYSFITRKIARPEALAKRT